MSRGMQDGEFRLLREIVTSAWEAKYIRELLDENDDDILTVCRRAGLNLQELCKLMDEHNITARGFLGR